MTARTDGLHRAKSLRFRVLGALAVAIGLLITPSAHAQPVQAQMACGPRSEILKALHSTYAEMPVAMGLAHDGNVLEVLATKNRGTWSIIITNSNGVTCLVSGGESWEDVPEVVGGVF